MKRHSWKTLSLVLSLLVGLAAGVWHFSHSSSPQDSSPAELTASQEARLASDARVPPTALESEPVTPSLPAGAVPVREADPRGTPTQWEPFAKKYAGLSRLEMEIALGGLSPLRRELQASIVRARIDAGQFTRIYPEGPINLTKLGQTEADRTIPNPHRAHAGYARGCDENGRSYVEYVSIPHGAYPDFDALQAEELWLHAQIRSLREAQPR